jgi:uncharacterized repeat protein (TIGR01451 family)
MKRAIRSVPKVALIVVPLGLALWASAAAAFAPFNPEGFVVATSKPESYKTSPAQLAPVAAPNLNADTASYADQSPSNAQRPDQQYIGGTASPSPIPGQAALVVEIAADRQSAKPGDTITYAVEVQNVGTVVATNVVALSHVPAGTSLSSSNECIQSGSLAQPVCVAPSSPGGSDPSTDHISHSMSSIPAGGLAIWRFTVVVNVSTPHGTIITNHAHAEAGNGLWVTSDSVEVSVS